MKSKALQLPWSFNCAVVQEQRVMISSNLLPVLHTRLCSPRSSTELSGSFPRQMEMRASSHGSASLPQLTQQQNCSCQQKTKSMVGQTQCWAIRGLGRRDNTARLCCHELDCQMNNWPVLDEQDSKTVSRCLVLPFKNARINSKK